MMCPVAELKLQPGNPTVQLSFKSRVLEIAQAVFQVLKTQYFFLLIYFLRNYEDAYKTCQRHTLIRLLRMEINLLFQDLPSFETHIASNFLLVFNIFHTFGISLKWLYHICKYIQVPDLRFLVQQTTILNRKRHKIEIKYFVKKCTIR
jgi:hypothetical protein